MENTLEMTTEVYRLIRELMSPLAKVYDPLYAGTFAFGQMSGPFYLTQNSQWLWLPRPASALKSGDPFLTDSQLAQSVELRDVLRNLLKAARTSFDVMLQHLEKIEGSPTFLTDVGLYLVRPEERVVDIIRAEGLSDWRPCDAG